MLRVGTVLFLLLLGSVVFVTRSVANDKCDALEIVEGNEEYNGLVCLGIQDMYAGENKLAIQHFEKALDLQLFEFPNFLLYPRLASAYFLDGDHEGANKNLEKARLSLSLFVGIYQCQEHESGFFIAKGEGAPLRSIYADEIADQMCGGSYDYVYRRVSLESVLRDARLIENFFQIKRRVEGSQIKY